MSDTAFTAVARRLVPDGQLLEARPLVGGSSANMHALEVRGPGGEVQRFALRRHNHTDWKPLSEDVTQTEFRLLTALQREGLPVPGPRLLDTSGEILPTPYFVMDLVDGTTSVAAEELPNALRLMAEFLSDLHALEPDRLALPPLPDREDPRDGCLTYLPDDVLGRRVREALTSGAAGTNVPPHRSFVHGDYWPGNVMWRDGRIAAVLDWEDAALGDPLSDLACCRVELACHYDESAAETFTSHYRGPTPIDVEGLLVWELYASSSALATMANWGLPPEVEAHRREVTQRFMERSAHRLLGGR